MTGLSPPDLPRAAVETAAGNAHFAAGRIEAAVACYRAAAAAAPDLAATHFNLANSLAEAGDAGGAQEAYYRCLALDPADASTRINLGNFLRARSRPSEALESYRRALHLRPVDPSIRYNIGTVLLDLHRPDEALLWFRQAAAGSPAYVPAFAACGEALLRSAHPREALDCFREALRRTPDDLQARFGAGLCRLTLGDLPAGWRDFEARLGDHRICGMIADMTSPVWDGTVDPRGKTMLVVAEQGLGDTMQFVRFVIPVRARGARVVLQVQAPLVAVLSGLADDVIAMEAPPPACDLFCPLLSLPGALAAGLGTLADGVPYVHAEPERVKAWAKRLGNSLRRRIGITISGNPDHKLDVLRSIPASDFAALLDRDDIEFHLLQNAIRPADAPALGAARHLHTHIDALQDWRETAALITHMDLVISVDTAVAHLAGAMGKPIWVLLPYSPDFRWMLKRTDTPWYPAARLFRQDTERRWVAVVANVTAALDAFWPRGQAQSHFLEGSRLWHDGAREAALSHLMRAVALDPGHADARNNLGNALAALGQNEDAITHYRAAIAVRPEMTEAHYNLANACVIAGHSDEAEVEYRAAVALNPDHAGAHNNLGNLLRARFAFDAAIESYRHALALRPDYFGTQNNIGAALLAQHRPAEALSYFHDSLRTRPDYAEACNNLGGALLALGRPDEALHWFRRAFARDPGLVQARFGEGLAQLSMGNFADGWPAYEARWLDSRFTDDVPAFADEPWRGEGDIQGKTLFVHAEQGLGDTLQFVRYLPLLRARGAHVVLQAQSPLLPLIGAVADAAIPAEAPVPAYDLRCPLLSLPFAFKTELASIPASIPYLYADASHVREWQRVLGATTGRRIGVAFSGSADHPDDVLRSISASHLLGPLVAGTVELHVLQNDIRAEDAEYLRTMRNIRVHAAELTDFARTAALIACMDLVISVDTSIAHLAGACGVPTWILLQFAADFRWLRNRDDSPWYPSVRLFRQRRPGDWDAVINGVVDALEEGRRE